MVRKNIKQKIKEYFFVNPTAKLRVRRIEKQLNLPLPSVIKYCKELEKEGILKRVEIGGVVFYTANRASENFIIEKKLFNIYSLYNSGLVGFLRKELGNPTIVVFGSYASGEDIEKSDVDIYIETPSKKSINTEKYEKIIKRRIHIFVYKHIHEIGNKELANNIVNGVVLNGFLEVL